MHRFWIGLALAAGAAASAACIGGGTASPPPKVVHHTCSGLSGKHHSQVVVVHGNGTVVNACVGFDQATMSGFSLMKNSNLELATQPTQFGPAVCQVDREPAHYDKCLPGNAPYWAAWVWNGQAWSMATTSYADVKLADHQAIGWEYTPQTGSPAPPPQPPAS